jgi:hypothetical protein
MSRFKRIRLEKDVLMHWDVLDYNRDIKYHKNFPDSIIVSGLVVKEGGRIPQHVTCARFTLDGRFVMDMNSPDGESWMRDDTVIPTPSAAH